MGSTASILVIGLLLNRAATCPTSYVDVDGVCVHISSQMMLFCPANAYCTSVDGELIHGETFMKVQTKNFSGRPSHHWIGLTDLLNERYRNSSNWRWTDGALEPKSSDINWKPQEPSGNREDCVAECKNGVGYVMCDETCDNFQSYAMCQPRSQPSLHRERTYRSVSTPVGLPAEEYARKGCWKLVLEVKSKMHCAFLCSSESNDWCVSFYFNKAAKECALVLYTDATSDLLEPAAWEKMVKQN